MARDLRYVWSRFPDTSSWRRSLAAVNSSTTLCRVVDYHYLLNGKCYYDTGYTQPQRQYQIRNYKVENIGTFSNKIKEQSKSDSESKLNSKLKLKLKSDDSNKIPSVSTSPSSSSPSSTNKMISSTTATSPSPSPIIENIKSQSTFTLVDKLPPSLKPYAQLARADKPIGTMLLLWPCCWSTAIAAAPTITTATTTSTTASSFYTIALGDPTLLVLFTTGSFLMRGAGCTVNDLWDAPYDASVSRTRSRPLPSGKLTTHQAIGFLTLQTAGGLAVLLSLPHLDYCFWLGAASLPLVATYPLMKRVMDYPQLVLGLTFNWGAFMGWAATHGSLGAAGGWGVVLPLYAGGVAWTLVYDTLYAHQDKEDDAKLGLRSTALTFGERGTKPVLLGCSGVAVGCWMFAGWNVGYLGPWYYGGCSLAGAHLVWQVVTANLGDGENLARRFRSNSVVGGVIFGSCVAGNLGNMIAVV